MYKEQESDYNESVGRKMTRKELKKLRNRLAQQKSRQKKLNTIYSLQMRVEELQKQLQEKNLLLRMLGH
jgi:galactokinase